MKLELIHIWDGSGGSNCPAFYKTDEGDYVVQGWKLPDDATAQLHNLADNETAVRIPGSLVAQLAASAGN